MRRHAREQVFQPEHGDDGVCLLPDKRAGRAPRPEFQVSAHAHVREQARVLEDVADAALARRHVEAGRGVQNHGAVQPHAAAVGFQQSCDDVDDGCLAAARGAEDGGDAGVIDTEVDVEIETGKPVREGDLGTQDARSLLSRLAASSEMISPVKASATAQTTSRSAAASPPGDWIAE